MKPVLIVGSLVYDRIMNFPGQFGDHILPEKVHQLSVSFIIDKVTTGVGGCGGNIAYTLSLLGTETDIAATAGNDFDQYAKHLTAHGISTASIAIDETLPTAGAYIMTDQKDNQITAFAPGAMECAYTQPLTLEGKTLAIVSPTNTQDMEQFPKHLKEAGVPFFFDPGQQIPALSPETLRSGIEGSAAVFVNDYELALVSTKTGWSEAEIATRTNLLVVTLGENGSRLVTKDGVETIPAVQAVPVDPTGAGDAYRAGFMHGFLRDLPHEICAKIGSVCGAYAVETQGTQNHTPSLIEIGARYQEAYSEPWPL